MARASAGQTLWDAWPQILHSDSCFGDVWWRGRAAATSFDLMSETNDLGAWLGTVPHFDAAVIQIGIVDSCPRPFPRRVQRLLEQLPNRWQQLVRRMYPLLLRARARPWVRPQVFKDNVASAVAKALGFSGRVLLLEIPEPGPGLTQKVGDFTVREYNDALVEVARSDPDRVIYVRVWDDGALCSALLPDGHHLSKSGHRSIAEAVKRTLVASAPDE